MGIHYYGVMETIPDPLATSKPEALFVGIRADASLQDRLARYLAELPAADPDDGRIELVRIGKHWHAGGRLPLGAPLERVMAFTKSLRHRLVEIVPEARFPEGQFRLWEAPGEAPGVVDEPADDEDPDAADGLL